MKKQKYPHNAIAVHDATFLLFDFSITLSFDGCAKDVVEVRGALGGRDRVASADVRLVDEMFVAALDEGKAVPKEGFGLRRARGARPTNADVGCARELAVGVVVVGAADSNRRQLRPRAVILARPSHAIDA